MSLLTRIVSLSLFLLLTACGENDAPPVTTSPTNASASSPGLIAELFEDLPAEQTGIDFINEVTSDFKLNNLTFAYLYNGVGIGVIDYDKDGLQDLFMASTQEQYKLYRNVGDFHFEDVTAKAGVAGPATGLTTGVSVVDINADGYQDIYISKTGPDNSDEGRLLRRNLLYVNNGDGTFTEKAAQFGVNSDHPGTQGVFFDYDQDGDLDLYQVNTLTDFAKANTIRAANTPTGPRRVSAPQYDYESDQLYRNDNGRFVEVTGQAGLLNRGFGLSASVGDFNSDGRPDIYVANDYIEPDYLYINQGDGTFKDEHENYLRHTSHNSMGSDLGDLNNDGLEDLVSLDMLAEDLERQKQLESAMRPDRYGTLVRLGYGHQLMRNQLQLSTGNGFSEVGEVAGISSTDWSWAPLLVDFDQDQHQDLFITNGYRYDITDQDFISFTTDSINALGGVTKKLFADFSDFLKLIPTTPLPNYLYRNTGDLQFDNVAADWNVATPAYSGCAVYADLDNDGDMDLVVGNHERPPFVYRNRAVESGQGGNWLQITADGGPGNPYGYGVRVEAVLPDASMIRSLQPSRGFLGSNQSVLHYGLGNATKIDQLRITWPDGKQQYMTDVKANQTLEVKRSDARNDFAARPVTAALFQFPADQLGLTYQHTEDPSSDLDRQFLQPRELGREGPALAVADVNGDGLEDVFIGAAAGHVPQLFLQTNQGKFTRSQVFTAADHQPYEDVAAEFVDVDGDGDLDLYLGSGGSKQAGGHASYKDRLLLNENGKFQYAPQWLAQIPAISTGAVVALDYDDDGDQDLIVGGRVEPGAYPNPPRSQVLRNDGNRFTEVTRDAFPALERMGMITSLVAGDVLGTGKPQVVIAGEWMPVGIYEFDGNKFERSSASPEGSVGFWHRLQLEDLDGDGRLEILAGNEGLNTRFRPEDGRTVALYAADFDGNGSVDPIVAMADQSGELSPIVNRAMLIKQLPKLKKQFVRTTPYTTATLIDAFGTGALQAADRYELQIAQSGVFKLEGDQFAFTPFPRTAQSAPGRGIAVFDFTGDGRKDLLLAGNDYGLQVETGRIDAGNGVLLEQKEDGSFKVIPNTQHQFWASLDARDLKIVKLAGGRRAVVVVNNNNRSAVYTLR